MKMQVYEYPLVDKEGPYTGSYTIRKGAKPLGFKGEKLVDEFEHTNNNIDWEKERQW